MFNNMTPAQRLFFINITTLSMIGIWLTGYDQVHWFVFVVPAALIFAALSGFCIGFEISKKILAAFGIHNH